MGERLAKKDFKANGVLPESEVRRTIIEGLIKFGASEINIYGLENLAEAKAKLDAGVPILGVGDHLSNADGPLFNTVLGRAGIIDPVFIFGIKLTRNPVTNALHRGANIIPVWPPSLRARNAKEEEQKKAMNEKAFNASRAVLNGGRLLVIFPEGGRSRDGQLNKGLPGTGEYLNIADDLEVMPMAIWETEKRLPVKRGLPKRGPVYLAFGKLRKASELPGFGMQNRVGRTAMIDSVMLDVANLLPEQYRGYYADKLALQNEQQQVGDVDLIAGEEPEYIRR